LLLGAWRHSLTLGGLVLMAWAVTARPTPASAWRWAKAMRAGVAAYEQANFAQAERFFKVAVKEAAKFDLGDPRAVQTLNAVGNLYRAEHKLDAAEMVLQRARARAEVSLRSTDPELAAALNNLGALCTVEQRFSEANNLEERAVAIVLNESRRRHRDP